jgi:hypothetical protein
MPRKVAEQSKKRMGAFAFLGTVIGVGILVIGGAIFIGKSDTGVIDVPATISNSNEISREENGDSATIVETTPNALRTMPNGGLVPQGEVNKNPAPESLPPTVSDATSTASTTLTEATTSAEQAQDTSE